MIQVFIFIRKNNKKKLKNETAHFRKPLFCSESFDQASLHATILEGFQCLMIDDINAGHFKNWGASLCSPISNRQVPPKK